MADISFNEEPAYRTTPSASREPVLFRLLMRWGLASDHKSAERFLLGVIGGCILLAAAVLFFLRPHVPPAATPLDPSWPKPVVR